MLQLAMPKKKNTKKRPTRSLIVRALTPSTVSSALNIGLSAIAVGLLLIIFMTNAGALQQNLINWHRDEPDRSLTLPGQDPPQNNQPALASNWPVLVLWATVGLLLYGLATYIVHTFTRAAHFKRTYTYVSALPPEVFETLVRQLELRCTALIILFGLAYVLAVQIVPYCILLIQAAAADLSSPHGVVYTFASFLVLTISLHALTVFARLSLGRTRLFT